MVTKINRLFHIDCIFIIVLYACSPANPNAGFGETILAFLNPTSSLNVSEEVPFTVEPVNPNKPILDEPTPSDAGFGSNGPEARFDFDPRGVDPYSSIRIRFSHSVDASSVVVGNNLIIRNGVGAPIPSGQIQINWTSPITLNIRTNPAFSQNTEYSLEINPSSSASQIHTPGSGFSQQNIHHFLDTFKTEPGFPVQLYVRSGSVDYSFSNNNSLVLDSGLHPQSGLRLRIQFIDSNNLSSIKSIALCKLGSSAGIGTIPCTDGVGNGIELCSESSCTSSIETSLEAPLPVSLQPQPGVNNYFYRIESYSGRYFYRTLNFVWGNLHKNGSTLTPQATMDMAANLSIVQDQGAKAVAGIIEAFAKGEFTLKDPSDNSNKTLNGYLNTSSIVHPGTVDGKSCLSWPGGKIPNGMKFLNRVGPFCGISVSGTIFESPEFPNVTYQATADIYITELTLDESIWDGSEWVQNAVLTINPENGYMDLTLNGRKASGRMAVVARVTQIEFFDYLLNDTLLYYTPPMGAPSYGSGQGADGAGISFGLNEGNVTPRRAFARTKITANASGDAVITMNPSAFPNPFNLATQCGSLPETVPFPFTFLCNPYTMSWSDNITTSSIVGSGAVAAIVGDVIEQKIPEVKPQVVQGVIRDIAAKVAPDILNNILGLVRAGITVNLPEYLPAPLNLVQLTIAAQLAEGDTVTRTRKSGLNFGLEAPAKAGLLACIRDGSNRCPWQSGYSRPAGSTPPSPLVPGFPTGQDSFVVQRNGLPRNIPSTIDRWSANPGVLLAIHEDALNQAFFWLWKTGGLNLTINRSFIDSINEFTGGSTLLRLTNSLLNADPILTVISPGASNFAGIYPNDDVDLVVTPVVSPQVTLKPLVGSTGNAFPKVGLNLSDLKLTVIGRRTDPARGSTPGTPYTIGTIRLSIQAEADLNLGTYNLPSGVPLSRFTPPVLASVGNPSIQLQISSESGKLFYILEVLDDPVNNPLGLRPDAIYNVIEPLVKDLIVPLLNNVVRDIPIPKLRACGLDLTNVKTLPIPVSTTTPYLLIHANAGNYGFFGNCEL